MTERTSIVECVIKIEIDIARKEGSSPKRKKLTRRQESIRKDNERLQRLANRVVQRPIPMDAPPAELPTLAG